MLYALYQAAAVYVFPAVEDFGIMPVEAMAAGAAVLAQTAAGSPRVSSPADRRADRLRSDADIRAGVER